MFCFVLFENQSWYRIQEKEIDLTCMCMLMHMVKCIWVCVAGSQDNLTGVSCLLPCEFQGSKSWWQAHLSAEFNCCPLDHIFLRGGIRNHFISNLNKMIFHYYISLIVILSTIRKGLFFLYYIYLFINSLILCLELFNVKRLCKNNLLYVRTNIFTKSRDQKFLDFFSLMKMYLDYLRPWFLSYYILWYWCCSGKPMQTGIWLYCLLMCRLFLQQCLTHYKLYYFVLFLSFLTLAMFLNFKWKFTS